MKRHTEIVIVGGGIAGASLAYFLARGGATDVILLEREAQAGHHATGRSAAMLAELDSVPTLLELKTASAGFFREPPASFSDQPILTRSGLLVPLRGDWWRALVDMADTLAAHGLTIEQWSADDLRRVVPLLDAERFEGAAFLPEDGRIDVHELLSSYLRHAKRAGILTEYHTTVRAIVREGERCVGVRTDAGEVRARWVVNAAGAWASEIGQLAAASSIALVPHRRTIAIFDPPSDVDVRSWPFVSCEQDGVYFAPESGSMLVCPMDETPVSAHDASPEEQAIAEAFERLGMVAPRLVPRSVRRSWAGLRTFAPDRVPVIGEDPRRPGFFWLAGQGGCGIETSPIVGAVAADLLLTGRSDRFAAERLAPARFSAGVQ